MAATLFINAASHDKGEYHEDKLKVDVETLLVLIIFKLCDVGNIDLKITFKDNLEKPFFIVTIPNLDEILNGRQPNIQSTLEINFVKLPALIQDLNGAKSIVAGVCSVARQLIKCSQNENTQFLLGFRESCLAACSESSIWTKFCEVDMVSTVRNVLLGVTRDIVEEGNLSSKICLPNDLLRFEYHMQQPVRMHNVYKVARETQNNKSIKSNVPVSNLNIPHCYSEGPSMTLSDTILFPLISVFIRKYSDDLFKDYLPLTRQWYEKMQEFRGISKIADFSFVLEPRILSAFKVEINDKIKKESLYSSDPNRYKPSNRIYTKQNDIESALNIIRSSPIELVQNNGETFGHEVEFNWEDIPMILRPEGGALPKKRSKRKEEQLENLVKAVIKLAKRKNALNSHQNLSEGIKIVDFCSGSGHLGLLLAYLLPDFEIILVENKEKSLERALERVKSLNLTNVTSIQSNLDYFQGSFDIGVSLHACGVATDLVMQNCIDNHADFVCCPCCYGGIHDCYHLKFPRSKEFAQEVKVDEYLKIAHAADQTHDEENVKTVQGYFCMDVIDSDRFLYAMSCGYDVVLCKLRPESCTPKNNLLVGIYTEI